MALPETIAVKYTEEEAEYMSLRPVVRQTFQLRELVDMILAVTGKDLARVQQVLRSGTVVFHYYRYWWPGFEACVEDLQELLRQFPDADPTRTFRAEDCVTVLVESSAPGVRRPAELRREILDQKKLFRTRSLWESLMDLAHRHAPVYGGYSYERRADLYALQISREELAALARDAQRLTPRRIRPRATALASAGRLTFVCPRPGTSGQA